MRSDPIKPLPLPIINAAQRRVQQALAELRSASGCDWVVSANTNWFTGTCLITLTKVGGQVEQGLELSPRGRAGIRVKLEGASDA